MSNLGDYQTFTTDAAKVGGVDAALAIIRSDAVKDARPGTLLLGAVIGVVGTFVTAHVVVTVQSLRARRKARAAEAEARLREGSAQ